MKNLFKENLSSQVDDLVEEIKLDIKKCYESKCRQVKNLQHKINLLTDYKAYEYFRLGGYSCFTMCGEQPKYFEFPNSFIVNKIKNGFEIYQIENKKCIKKEFIKVDTDLENLEFPNNENEFHVIRQHKKINKIASILGIDLISNQFTDCINSWYQGFKEYLDLPESDFYSSFPGNFRARVYELVMAEFLHGKFTLQKRCLPKPRNGELPDFEFILDGKKYFLECSVRMSSMMDKFCKSLPELSLYLEVAEVFNNKLYELKEADPLWKNDAWHYMVNSIWDYLSREQRIHIIEIFREVYLEEMGYEVCFEIQKHKLKKGIFYIENLGDYIEYNVIDPNGKMVSGKISEKDLGIRFCDIPDLKKSRHSLLSILDIASKRGHIYKNSILSPPHVEIWVFKKMEEWIYHTLYALHNFPHILPDELMEKLTIIFPNSCRSENMDGLRKFLVNCIVQKIFEKLKNPYCSKGIPIIFSVSVAPLPNDMLTTSALEHIALSTELRAEINRRMDKKVSAQDFDIIEENFKNLYAIIIDTTWYNWFPGIVEVLYDAKFPEGFRNYYYVIYNKNVCENTCHDLNIFNPFIAKRSEFDLSDVTA